MGQSIAITYTVTLLTRGESGQLFTGTPAEWRVRSRNRVPGYGKPTRANLVNYIALFEASTESQGCNSHLGVQKVVSAAIVHQASGQIVETYVSKAQK